MKPLPENKRKLLKQKLASTGPGASTEKDKEDQNKTDQNKTEPNKKDQTHDAIHSTFTGGLFFDEDLGYTQTPPPPTSTVKSPDARQRINTPTSGWSRVSPGDAEDLPELPPENISPLNEESFSSTQERNPMSNQVNDVLDKLASIEGFIAAAIGDSSSGMTLGSKGGSDAFNVEVAIAANTEVVKAKNRAMRSLKLDGSIEDILITLSDQYHLIRPLADRPEIFLYIAVDREHANLAMTRFTLGDAEKMLDL